jgi:hypothetical protein
VSDSGPTGVSSIRSGASRTAPKSRSHQKRRSLSGKAVGTNSVTGTPWRRRIGQARSRKSAYASSNVTSTAPDRSARRSVRACTSAARGTARPVDASQRIWRSNWPGVQLTMPGGPVSGSPMRW